MSGEPESRWTMKRLRIFGWVVSIALAAVLSSGQEATQPPQQDKAQPGVARISMLRGDVSIKRGDSGDWVAATLNTPIMAGDKVSTGQNSLTELQLDYANILRISSQAGANVTNLDPSRIQVQIAQGLAFYTVFGNGEAAVEIDTPNVAVHPVGEGEYRIQVNSSGETVVVVRNGEADLSTPQGSTRVHKGQEITIRGEGAEAQYLIADAPGKDQWDRLNEDRDKRIRSAQSWAHVTPYYAGADDLDAYGHWTSIPDYGWVWSPRVAVDWAPYRDGNWVWEPFYGWTWVSYEPWGWAPYHYGRWCRWHDSWVWWPGPRWYRPLWAPAYVSFFGFGAGSWGLSFGFGFGFGSIGWFPIGPCDAFYPWYGGFGLHFGFADFHRFRDHGFYRGHAGAIGPLAGRYDERFSNFRMAERDPRLLHGATSMRAEDFGRVGGHRAAGVSETDFRNGRMMTGGVPSVPTRESLASTVRSPSQATMRNGQATRFFSDSRAPAAQRLSFNEQAGRVQSALRDGGASFNSRANAVAGGGGRPAMDSRPGASTRPSTGAVTQSPGGSAAISNRAGQASGGWRSFGGSRPGASPGGSTGSLQTERGSAGAARTAPPANNPRSNRPQGNSGSRESVPQMRPQSDSSAGWQSFGSSRPGGSSAGRTGIQTDRGAAGATRTVPPAGNSPSNRPPGKSGSREPVPQVRPQSGSSGGWQSFTERSSGAQVPSNRASSNFAARQTPQTSSQSGGWQNFTQRQPEPQSRSYAGRSYSSAPSQPRYQGNPGYYRGTAPSYNSRPSYSAPSYGSRPPLNLSRPIISGPPRVAPSRSYGNFGGGASRSGGFSRPSGGGSRPSGGGSRSSGRRR